MKRVEGPAFLRVKINRLETQDIPRITTKYQPSEITEQFRNAATSPLTSPTSHPA